MRQILLDTETTGIDPKQGHRIIEIGCVEMVKRRMTDNNYHQYLQPDREIDAGAVEVHGITNDFLADKPRFHEVVDAFMEYIKGAELIIHNAPFDVGFINHELQLAHSRWGCLEDHCTVIDTLVMARTQFPGQKNNLDALCKRYFIDNSHRTLHGALLDSQILGDVYLAMTGGQVMLSLGDDESKNSQNNNQEFVFKRLPSDRTALRVIKANDNERVQHEAHLKMISTKSEKCLWMNLE